MGTQSVLAKVAVVGAVLAAMVLPSVVGYHYYGKAKTLQGTVQALTDELVQTQDILQSTLVAQQRTEQALAALRAEKEALNEQINRKQQELDTLHLRTPGYNNPVMPAIADRLREANREVREGARIRPQ